ncbi:retron system putative HNH endonuclease, partial [Tistrella mobilis]
LHSYTCSVNRWDDVSSIHKEQIRKQLEAMQGRRCAYCEGSIDGLGQHIEHFRRKKHHPALTFEWSNLFWSCNQTDSCGHFKDRRAGSYNVADLIDPCADDPDDFFIFWSDGTISVRNGLSKQEEHRAKETLRVFSLHPNFGRLRNMRKSAVAQYVNYVADASEYGFSDEDIRELIAGELQVARDLPFYTTIRHVLTERQ